MKLCDCVILALLGAHVSMATMASEGSGISRVQPRIIGGQTVSEGCKAPFNSVVALQFYSTTGNFTFCSGVLISDTYVVTTGYCAFQISTLGENIITAVIAERDLYMTDTNEQRITLHSFKFHPQYNVTTFDHNIALLRLSTKATISPCVMPAAKMEADPSTCNDLDQTCLIAGWGPYAETANPVNSRLLRYMSVVVMGEHVSTLYARNQQGRDPPIGSIYAEAVIPTQKACFFDWGGIVSCVRNGNYVLRGLIGEHSCNSDSVLPILVTDMSTYQTWTNDCMNDWDRC